MAKIQYDDGNEIYIDDAVLRADPVKAALSSAIPAGKQEVKQRIKAYQAQLDAMPKQPNDVLLAWARANNPYEQQRAVLDRFLAAAKEELKKWP